MTAKRKSPKRPAKRKPAARKAAKSKGATKVARKVARKAPARAPKRKPAPRPKGKSKTPRQAPPGGGATAAPVEVTAFTMERVEVQPLRYEAAAALGRLETVQLFAGRSEEGARVETLVFSPTGKGAQSSGEFVHRGDWNGTRLLTDKGHLLDVDGACFCRDCEAAGGYTVDDDE